MAIPICRRRSRIRQALIRNLVRPGDIGRSVEQPGRRSGAIARFCHQLIVPSKVRSDCDLDLSTAPDNSENLSVDSQAQPAFPNFIGSGYHPRKQALEAHFVY